MSRLSLVVISVITLIAGSAARSEPLTYQIEITLLGSQADAPQTLVCSEDKGCQGEIELHIGEVLEPLIVHPLFMRDEVIVTFRTKTMPVTANERTWVHVPLNSSHAGHMMLTLKAPAIAEKNGLFERELSDAAPIHPVWRSVQWPVKQSTTSIDVSVRPSN